MSESAELFSQSLHENITLSGEALRLYSYVQNCSRSPNKNVDPVFYPQLVSLGYNYDNRGIFGWYRAPNIKELAELGVSREIAEYAYALFGDDGRNYKYQGTWVAEALPLVNVTKAKELEGQEWSQNYAIIISAFPEREARLKEVIEHNIHYYDQLAFSHYDVAMLARLNKRQGSSPSTIIEALDNGYTEKEILSYGFTLVFHFSPAELRQSKAKPLAMKSVFSVFSENTYRVAVSRFHGGEPQYFVPTVSQLEALVNAGFKNGKQYKKLATMIGMKALEAEFLDMALFVVDVIDYSQLEIIYNKLGYVKIEDLPVIARMFTLGKTLEEYFEILDAVNPATEEFYQRAVSPATSIFRLLKLGVTPKQVSIASDLGVALANM